MPKFRYDAVNMSGVHSNGEYLAPDSNSVAVMLRQTGYYPISVTQISEDVDRVTKRKIKIKPISGFCSQMSAMLRAGVPITKALEIQKNQTEDTYLCKILEDVYIKVLRGIGLYDAFTPYRENFPSVFLNMLEAGEASGTLDVCLERAGTFFTRNAKLNSKIKAAMVYPAILMVLMVGIVTLLLVFVIPTFADLFAQNNAELPVFTQALVNLSNFVATRWYVILLVIATITLGFKIWLSTDKGRLAFDKSKLRIPVISKLLLKVYASRYSRTLSSMNAAGVPLIQALDVVARSISNRFIEDKIYKVAEAVNHGEGLSNQLEQMGVLPPMIVYMTRIGEESGTMDALLEQAADFYDNESETALQTLTSLLEPLMIILMAILVLPVILAIMLPVFNMYEMIS